MTTFVPKATNEEATALLHFSEYNTFQGFYKLSPADDSISSNLIFNKCILYITDWLKSRIDKNLHCDKNEVRFLKNYPALSDLEEGESYDVFTTDPILERANTQFDIAVFGLKELGEWTIRIREPNNQEDKGFLDWLFTTDIALKQNENFVCLAIRTKCKESHAHGDKATPFRPTFLRGMFSDKCFVVTEGGFDSNYPIEMDTLGIYMNGNQKKDDYIFIDALRNPSRQMPIIICPSCLTAESEHDRFRIEKLSKHMAGMAYVIVDEAHNGYKYLFERMEEFFKNIGEKKHIALEKIKTNYLCINPMPDETTRFKWFPVDPEANKCIIDEKDRDCPLRVEIRQAEKYVCEYYLRRGAEANFNFGSVLFYSDLWNEYVNKSDSKKIEELKSQLDNAKNVILQVKANAADNEEIANLNSVISDLEKQKEDLEKLKESREKERDKYKEDVEKRERDNNQLKDDNEKLNKTISDLEEKYKNYDSLKAEKQYLDFFHKLWSKPYSKKDLLDWVENNMGDLIQIDIPNAAKNECKAFIKNYADGYRLRDAFIRLYAERLFISGEMPEEVYNKVKADKSVSCFQVEMCGGDKDKCKDYYGVHADWHVTFSGNFSKGVFRIYFNINKEDKGYTVIAIDDHVK